jgi:DNA polymerase III gamma/tau subunit
MPKDLITTKELPTAKDIASIIGKVDRERKAIIFSKTKDEITEARIDELKGTIDKFKITIESYNREDIPTALQEMMEYIENIREIKNTYEKITSEIDEKIKNINESVKRNDFQIKEIEKRLSSSKLLPVGFNPIEINNKMVDLKMEKHRLEQERLNYKLIQLMQDPLVSNEPVKPQKAVIMTIAGILSLMFGIFIAFIAEYFEGMKKRKQRE